MGGKSQSQTVGFWYLPAYHAGLGVGPIDAFLEFRGGDKPAWQGELTASGTISINAPNLWGGEKDQGGIVGSVDVMFGEVDQQPNAYLASVFGSQQPAWRGLATLVFKGGKYGAMNPYPQKASYKIRKITKGWDNDDCWYPSKAVIASTDQTIVSNTATGWEYVQLPRSGDPYQPGYDDLFAPAGGWAAGQSPFGSGGWTPTGLPARNTPWNVDTVLWVRRNLSVPSSSNAVIQIFAENGCCIFINGAFWRAINQDNVQIPQGDVIEFQLPPGDYELSIKAFDEYPTLGDTYLSASVALRYGKAMNPAHILYYAITQADMGREPASNINNASFAAAADWFYANGFGLCTWYDPSAESVEEFQQRICRVAGCSMTRSLIDGQWYLDIANGEYELDSLPILTDDDILEFAEQPTLLDSTVNSVSVKYFDPEKKEAIVTPPVQAPALIAEFGANHVTLDYQEIPNAALATRVAQRELLARITPLRGFPLKTTRKPYAWRPSTYFRLQVPKRGIADMVCIFSEKSSGQLRSGAMSISATQDIYSVPEASFVEVEDGVNTTPTAQPSLITRQRVFESPYTVLSATLSHADLAAMPAEAGYLLAVADDPATTRDYTLITQQAGSEYEVAANGEWTPTALVIEAAGRLDTAFTLASGRRLANVTAGMAGLWDDEIVRVDAINAGVGGIELGRGCADTIPQEHAANSRIWFYDAAAAGDVTEYSDAETVNAKLLDNTATQQFPEGSAIPLSLTFDQRAFRPYPPANFKINGQYWPDEVNGDIELTWNHRDRVAQANILLDTTEASTGPEAGVTYTAEFFTETGTTPLHSEAGIATDNFAWTPPNDGSYRVELKSVRGGVDCWQTYMHVVRRGEATEWSPVYLFPTDWFDFSDAGTITMVSEAVSAISNKGSSGRVASQSTGSDRPAFLAAMQNGRSVAAFDGTTDYLSFDVALNTSASMWVAQVFRRASPAINSIPLGGAVGGAPPYATFWDTGYIRYSALWGGTSGYATHGSSSMATGVFQHIINKGLTNTALYQDGTLVGTAQPTLSGTGQLTYLGRRAGSYHNGWLCEIIAGDGALSDTDREKLEGYLAHKWGLTANLPGGHPYKSTPPAV